MNFLCSLEAVNLANLFGDCQDLSTTRGGGLAVLNIARDVAKELCADPDKDIISAGASQGLLRIEGESADDVEYRVRRELAKLEFYRHTTITVSARPEETGTFPEQCARLKAAMRWSQMKSPSVIYPKLADTLVCDIDRVRPGLERRDLQKKKHQSDFTFERRKLGRERKKDIFREIFDSLPDDFEVAEDLNGLVAREPGDDLGNLKDKIAVLRFDGNDFGKIARQCDTAQRLKDFSETTRRQQREFFRKLLMASSAGIGPEWWTPDPKRLRLEIVVYGGDEVTFIVPAWLGWKALLSFYQQDFSLPGQAEPLTYSGGIVFCHQKSPIHVVRKLASDLADQAKDRAKNAHGKKGNFAAYQVLESFDSIGQELDEFMNERYAFAGNRGVVLGREEILLLDAEMEFWRTVVSKRQLHRLVGNMIAKSEAPIGVDLLTDSKAARERIGELHDRIGPAAFFHILELWDYAGAPASGGSK